MIPTERPTLFRQCFNAEYARIAERREAAEQPARDRRRVLTFVVVLPAGSAFLFLLSALRTNNRLLLGRSRAPVE
jgi:hypothetical protein